MKNHKMGAKMVNKFLLISLAAIVSVATFKLELLNEPIDRIKSERFAERSLHASKIEKKAISALYYKYLQEHCNRTTVLKLTEALDKTESHDISLEIKTKALQECEWKGNEKNLIVMSLLMSAKKSSNLMYIRDAISEIEKSGLDSTQIRIELAVAHQKIGNYQDSVDLFFEVFSAANLNNVTNSLIFKYFQSLEGNGDLCEAGRLLRATLQSKDISNKNYVISEIKRVEKMGSCIQENISTPIVIKISGSQAFLNARIGNKTGKFLIDTGATTTTIRNSFLNSIEDSFKSNIRPVRMLTAGGTVEAKKVTITNGAISSFDLPQFDVVGTDTMEDIGDFAGLLGMNLLSRFDMKIQGNTIILKQPEF